MCLVCRSEPGKGAQNRVQLEAISWEDQHTHTHPYVVTPTNLSEASEITDTNTRGKYTFAASSLTKLSV